jgi:hypothetical protein
MANDDNPYTRPLPFYRTATGERYILYSEPLSRQAEWDSIIKLEHEVLRLKRAVDQYSLSGGGDPSVQAQYEAAKAELEARKAAFGT